jgi:hypothetical protein
MQLSPPVAGLPNNGLELLEVNILGEIRSLELIRCRPAEKQHPFEIEVVSHFEKQHRKN